MGKPGLYESVLGYHGESMVSMLVTEFMLIRLICFVSARLGVGVTAAAATADDVGVVLPVGFVDIVFLLLNISFLFFFSFCEFLIQTTKM